MLHCWRTLKKEKEEPYYEAAWDGTPYVSIQFEECSVMNAFAAIIAYPCKAIGKWQWKDPKAVLFCLL